MVQYCFEHADRVAAGENVIDDLVDVGLVESYLADTTCAQAQQEKRQSEFMRDMIDACERSGL